MNYQCGICEQVYKSYEKAKECEDKGIAKNLMEIFEMEVGSNGMINFVDCEETSMSYDKVLYLELIGARSGNGSFDSYGDQLDMHEKNLAMLGGMGKKYKDNTVSILYYRGSRLRGHDREYYFTYSDNPSSNLEMSTIYGENFYLPLIRGNDLMQNIIDKNKEIYLVNGKFYLGGTRHIGK